MCACAGAGAGAGPFFVWLDWLFGQSVYDIEESAVDSLEMHVYSQIHFEQETSETWWIYIYLDTRDWIVQK
jgi:hypothetical protein